MHIRSTLTLFAFFFATATAFSQGDSLRHLDVLCGNDLPLTPFDSLLSYPLVNWEATAAVLSPDGKMIAFQFQTHQVPFMRGVQIYDLQNRSKVRFFPGVSGPQWHPNERKLLTSFTVYDIDADVILDLPVQINGRSLWSPDGKYIYYQTGVGSNVLLRSYPDGSYLKELSLIKMYSYPLTNSTFLSFYSNGIEITDTAGVKKTIEQQWIYTIRMIHNISISPDGRFVLADFWENGSSVFNGKQFLGMLDLETYMLKKVLPSQRIGYDYYPSWTSRGTIIVSYACRVDSVYTVWEIDTNGVFLRQLLGKEVLQTLTSVENSKSLPVGFSVASFFPHPGNGNGIIEYSTEKPDTFSLSLISLSGRVVHGILKDILHEPGSHQASIRTDDIPPGMYLIRLSNSQNQSVYHKIVIER